MTPAEFYVSSDALVHLQISTEYLSKSCRTVGLMPCPASKQKLAVEVKARQATPARRVKCIIGASLSEPHTSEPNGGFFIYIIIYLPYVRIP